MESSELSEQTPTAEDLSERSYESNSRSRSSSINSSSNPSDSSFRPYQGFEELAAKPEEDAHATVLHSLPANNDYDDYLDNTPIALDKPKDSLLARPAVYSDPTARSNSSRETGGNPLRASSSVGSSSSSNLSGSHKDALHNFYREIREIRQKALERHQSVAAAAAVGKDLDLMKSYGLPLKDLGELRSRIAIDRLRTGSFHGGEATTLEAEELKQSLQQLQSRVPTLSQSAPGVESSLAFERLRQSHPLFQAAAAAAAVASESAGQTSVAAPFAAHPPSLHQPQQQQAFTQLQLQQRQVQQQQQQQQQQRNHHHHHHHHHHHQQQQQQQQAKSFTIDAILGLREKQQPQQRQQSYRKQQGQASNGPDEERSSGGAGLQDGGGNASSSASGPGKLKRVRTIFTAEQLERLEGEFARQQYMVGPERLYLAHALRLTEAQVKVWFQNRRIKWRKVNHEQQSQRLHELGQTAIASSAAIEPDDCSNENSPDW
ncbi:hypothetical protein TKK_0001744 [Trichogramma kaykai]|uniref:Homeobox domain-containing protein n=1 Tax=Trichogramma kaykai TaxID=54128 RepID=A0ABD2XEX1_9HYME